MEGSRDHTKYSAIIVSHQQQGGSISREAGREREGGHGEERGPRGLWGGAREMRAPDLLCSLV